MLILIDIILLLVLTCECEDVRNLRPTRNQYIPCDDNSITGVHCIVKQPSNCRDLRESQSHPGRKFSFQACSSGTKNQFLDK